MEVLEWMPKENTSLEISKVTWLVGGKGTDHIEHPCEVI